MAKLRVLVVEDEPGMLDIMRVNLEHMGFEVVPARDGVEAWQQLEESGPDALVLDLGLPQMSGFRVLKLLRRDRKLGKIPVVVVTSYSFEEVAEIASDGVESFIQKPFDPDELASRVKYAMARRTSYDAA
jgi:two-component system, OmpR family, phosphate regulon response regulator PhoB